jgi:hypothetical protein
LPKSEPHLDDFFIGRFPITMGEYLPFINELAIQDVNVALARLPRYGGVSYLVRAGRSELVQRTQLCPLRQPRWVGHQRDVHRFPNCLLTVRAFYTIFERRNDAVE